MIKNVMASASESEFAALFIKARYAIVIINTLEEMRNKQWIDPCKDMWHQQYINTNINQHIGHKIDRINGSDPYMDQDNK